MIESKQTEFHPKNGLHGIQLNPRMWHVDNHVQCIRKNYRATLYVFTYSSFFIYIHLRFLWSSSLCNFQLNFNATGFFPHIILGNRVFHFESWPSIKKYDIKIARRIPLFEHTHARTSYIVYSNIHALSFILTFINVLTTVFVTTTTNLYN